MLKGNIYSRPTCDFSNCSDCSGNKVLCVTWMWDDYGVTWMRDDYGVTWMWNDYGVTWMWNDYGVTWMWDDHGVTWMRDDYGVTWMWNDYGVTWMWDDYGSFLLRRRCDTAGYHRYDIKCHVRYMYSLY